MPNAQEVATGSASAKARSVPEVKLGRMPALETGAALLFARVSPGGGLLLDLSLGVLDVQAMFLESTPGCRTSPSGLIKISAHVYCYQIRPWHRVMKENLDQQIVKGGHWSAGKTLRSVKVRVGG